MMFRSLLCAFRVCVSVALVQPSNAPQPGRPQAPGQIPSMAGRTLYIENRNGRSALRYLPDGKFSNELIGGASRTEGVWRQTGRSVCVQQTHPLPPGLSIGPEFCLEFPQTEHG